jgi:hypothetical protein
MRSPNPLHTPSLRRWKGRFRCRSGEGYGFILRRFKQLFYALTQASNHLTAWKYAASCANLFRLSLKSVLTANPCSAPEYNEVWYVAFCVWKMASAAARCAGVLDPSSSAKSSIFHSFSKEKMVQTRNRRDKPPKAILSGLLMACHSTGSTPLGCAVNPASKPFPGARNRATYFPPKLRLSA